jgi:hypothetical protein
MAADTDIQTLGKTYHRNFKKPHAVKFLPTSRSVPKNKALGFDISKSSIAIIIMRCCSNDLVALFKVSTQSVILSKVLISTHFEHPLQFPYRYFCRNAVRLHLTLELKNLTTASLHSYYASEKYLRRLKWFCFAQ